MKRTLIYLVGALGLYARAVAGSSALPSAQDVAAKWETRTRAAQQDYLDGVATTDKDPTALAITAGQRYINNVTQAFNDGSWANGLRKVGKTGWQAAVAAKGGTAFANGVAAAQNKVAAAFGPLLTFEQNVLNEIATMPNITDNDRDQRMLRWAQRMRTYVAP